MQLKERVFFTRYFSILLHAGLTIQQSIAVLADQLTSSLWKKILPRLDIAVKGGQKLSDALLEFPNEFPPFYSRMLAVGEKSGNLAEVFNFLQKQLTKDWLLVSKVKRAFIYPVAILCVLLSVSVGMVVFIVPRVAKLFTQMKIELPLPTRVLIKSQVIISNYGLYIVVGIVLFIFICKYLLKLDAVKRGVDRVILYVPLAGSIVRNLNLARFMQMLTTLLGGGVTIVNALGIVSSTISNSVYRDAILKMSGFVEGGRGLGDAIKAQPHLFPTLMAHMINIGEKTGNLQKQAEELSIFYTREVNNSVKTLSSMIEPLLLIVVAAGVGGIALSIVLPLYQLPNAIHR